MTPPLVGDFDTLGQVLAAAGSQHGECDAFVEAGGRTSFSQFVERTRVFAAALDARGLRPGDVLAIALPSGTAFAIAYAAAAWAGLVVTALNPRLGPREVDAILARAAPAFIVTEELFAGLDWDGPESAAPAAVEPGDPAVIIWTSGTTGTPKGAWFDHRNLKAAALTAGVMSAPYDRKLFATPFAHAGFLAKLWDQLVWGTAVVVQPLPWTAFEMAEVLQTERITVAAAVPTQWARLLEELHWGRHDVPELPHLRLGIAATAPASPALIRRVGETIGVPLVVRYAMTESPSICGTEIDDPVDVQSTTVGRPQAGMEIAIVDEDEEPLPDGQVGQIRVRGPMVMRGYWNDPEQTALSLVDGWLRTGDLGLLTPAGNLRLVGRAGDMYIRGGYKIHPLEVENVLAAHSGVARVSVIAVPDPVMGEIGVACVVPSDPADPPTLAVLRSWVADHLADYKRPDRLVSIKELPLTAMQKIDRRALRTELDALPLRAT